MKKILTLFLCTILFISLNAQNNQAKYYQIKSGYLKTEYSGNTIGTRELWWDNYGAKSCELVKTTTTTKFFGMSNTKKAHAVTIRKDSKYWSINYIDKSGVKGNIDEVIEDTEDISEDDLKKMGEEMFNMLGGEKQGTETIGGYTCDVYTVMGAKTWIYKGISLKSTAKIMGINLNEMFTIFKPNTSVPASKFVVPKDIEFKDINQMKHALYDE